MASSTDSVRENIDQGNPDLIQTYPEFQLADFKVSNLEPALLREITNLFEVPNLTCLSLSEWVQGIQHILLNDKRYFCVLVYLSLIHHSVLLLRTLPKRQTQLQLSHNHLNNE